MSYVFLPSHRLLLLLPSLVLLLVSREEIDSASSSRSAEPNRVAAVDGCAPLSAALAEGFASSLRTQDEVDALCRRYGIPREFAAFPTGNRSACTLPPPGTVCVYAHALEAGMRVPLHGFFCEALSHFGLVPSQLVHNGWRIMADLVVLCHFCSWRCW